MGSWQTQLKTLNAHVFCLCELLSAFVMSAFVSCCCLHSPYQMIGYEAKTQQVGSWQIKRDYSMSMVLETTSFLCGSLKGMRAVPLIGWNKVTPIN